MFNAKEYLNDFKSISLAEMDSVSLMNRVDTKFVLNEKSLPSILKELIIDYNILEIDGLRLMKYHSLYFDTIDKEFYTTHHNQRINRVKVRIRNYVHTNLSFLEVKIKNKKGLTKKTRIEVPGISKVLSPMNLKFIEKISGQSYELSESLWNDFNRLALVHKTKKERVTIDLNITYANGSALKALENLAIVEVKQKKFDRSAPIVKLLKKHSYHPYSISKYCIGVLSLYQGVKHNAFKQKLLKVKQITTTV